MVIEKVTPEDLKAAMPLFKAESTQKQRSVPTMKLSLALKVRCGIVDYILNGDGLTEDRLYQLIAEMPLDV